MSVSHLVEKSSGIVKREEGRTGALGKVVIVGNYGDLLHGIGAGYQVLGLASVLAHPSTSRFEFASVVVMDED